MLPDQPDRVDAASKGNRWPAAGLARSDMDPEIYSGLRLGSDQTGGVRVVVTQLWMACWRLSPR